MIVVLSVFIQCLIGVYIYSFTSMTTCSTIFPKPYIKKIWFSKKWCY